MKFTMGVIAGTMIGVGVAMMVNPVEPRDMKKMQCKANHIIKKLNRLGHMW